MFENDCLLIFNFVANDYQITKDIEVFTIRREHHWVPIIFVVVFVEVIKAAWDATDTYTAYRHYPLREKFTEPFPGLLHLDYSRRQCNASFFFYVNCFHI